MCYNLINLRLQLLEQDIILIFTISIQFNLI